MCLSRVSRHAILVATAVSTALWLAACEDDTAPAPFADSIRIVSGDDQYSKQGTELENPVVVRVLLADGSPAEETLVRFSIAAGGGSLSRTSATTDGSGMTSVRWTLGDNLDPQRLRASVADVDGVSITADAISAEYYCPEEDPTFARQFTPAGDVFLLTRQSSLLVEGGQPAVGVLQLSLDTVNLTFEAIPLVRFDEDILVNVVRDCAFGANGNLYMGWTTGAATQEVLRVAANRSTEHIATLESFFGTEITGMPGGVLAGCDEFGPFTIGCRDTLTRYEDATYGGTAPDAANMSAVAVDAGTGDLYFIYLADRSLRRVPLDGYTQSSATEHVATLELDEAYGAGGMVVDADGSVFILVESTGTKSLVKVTSAGVKTTAYDFFTRGAGTDAGTQSDLAINRTARFLYTLDTQNDVLLLYRITVGDLFELVSDGDPGAASIVGGAGERVGLAVAP